MAIAAKKTAPAPEEKPQETAQVPVQERIRPKIAKRMKGTHLQLSGDGALHTIIEYNLPVGHSLKDILKPEYWTSEITKFSRPVGVIGDYSGCLMHVRPVDYSFFAELFINEVKKTGLVVSVLRYDKFGVQAEDIQSENFSFQWNEREKGYDILRKADGARVVNGRDCQRLDGVQQWLNQWDR